MHSPMRSLATWTRAPGGIPIIGVDCHDGGALLPIVHKVSGYDAGETEANARLIAEAPALVTSLRSLLGLAEEAVALRQESEDAEDHEMLDVYLRDLETAREALARIEGAP